jgi:hypothetical protein
MTSDEIKIIRNIFTSYEDVVSRLLKLAKSHSSDPAKITEANGLESERKLLGLNMYEQLSPGRRGRPQGTVKKEPTKSDIPYCIRAVRQTIGRYPNKDTWKRIEEVCSGKSEETMLEDMAYFYSCWQLISGNPVNLTWLISWYGDNYLPPNVSRLLDNPRPEHVVKNNGFKKQGQGQNQPTKEEPLTDEDSNRIAAIIAKRGTKANT